MTPLESRQDLRKDFRHGTVRAREPGEGRIVRLFESECICLSTRCKDWDTPVSGISGNWGNHIVAHWTQEHVCVERESLAGRKGKVDSVPGLSGCLSEIS